MLMSACSYYPSYIVGIHRFSGKRIFDGTIRVYAMSKLTTVQTRGDFSDDELEEIIDMRATKDPFSVAEVRATIKENPLLAMGLVFALGLLVGVSVRSSRGHD